MKTQIKKMKQELKSLAKSIKEQKQLRKQKHIRHSDFIGHHSLSQLRWRFRAIHVAYCLMRGRKLEQVDSGVGLDMDYVNWIIKAANPESKEKLYVVVDEKLTISQQAVQSAHAVAEFLKKNSNTLWDNGYLVLLRHSNTQCWGVLRNYKHEYVEFKEPDLGNKVTAYACFGPSASQQLKGMPLL